MIHKIKLVHDLRKTFCKKLRIRIRSFVCIKLCFHSIWGKINNFVQEEKYYPLKWFVKNFIDPFLVVTATAAEVSPSCWQSIVVMASLTLKLHAGRFTGSPLLRSDTLWEKNYSYQWNINITQFYTFWFMSFC